MWKKIKEGSTTKTWNFDSALPLGKIIEVSILQWQRPDTEFENFGLLFQANLTDIYSWNFITGGPRYTRTFCLQFCIYAIEILAFQKGRSSLQFTIYIIGLVICEFIICKPIF